MDPSHFSAQFPSASSPPLMYNFMKVPPITIPPYPNTMQGVGGPSLHSSTRVMELQREHLRLHWHQQILLMDQDSMYKQHPLPLARIKKIMKMDADVKMVSGDTPVLFAKACELFILELTMRSWLHAEGHRRLTIRRSDIASAICQAEELDFLMELVPPDELRGDEDGGLPGANLDDRSNQPDPQQFGNPEEPPAPYYIISEPPPPL